MVTKKIILNELRNLAKRIIKEESNETLMSQLHTLVGNEMKLEKRADMSGGAEHHVKAHKNAKMELEKFLKQNPSMSEYVEKIEDHFLKQLYQ
jgi:hypothetical protein